jgi:hypothetical protein
MFNAFNFRHSSKDFDHKTKFIKKKTKKFFLVRLLGNEVPRYTSTHWGSNSKRKTSCANITLDKDQQCTLNVLYVGEQHAQKHKTLKHKNKNKIKKFLLECTYNRSKFQNHWILYLYVVVWIMEWKSLKLVLSRMSKHRKIIFKLWYDNKLILPFTYQCLWWKKDPQLSTLEKSFKVSTSNLEKEAKEMWCKGCEELGT